MTKFRIDDGGRISIDDRLLDCCLAQNVLTTSPTVWDDQTLIDESGDEKVFNGFDCTKITITLLFFEAGSGEGQTALDSLKALRACFVRLVSGEPEQLMLLGPRFESLNVKTAYFTQLDTDNDENGNMMATMSLTETKPEIARVEEQQGNDGVAPEEPETDDETGTGETGPGHTYYDAFGHPFTLGGQTESRSVSVLVKTTEQNVNRDIMDEEAKFETKMTEMGWTEDQKEAFRQQFYPQIASDARKYSFMKYGIQLAPPAGLPEDSLLKSLNGSLGGK